MKKLTCWIAIAALTIGTIGWSQQGSITISSPGAPASSSQFDIVSTTLAPGGSGTPGFQPAAVTAGCGVEYVSGLTFTVGQCQYQISGNTYSITALSSVTLSAADATNPRIDVIAVDDNGAVVVIVGTPAASPAQPTVDVSTQLGLTFITVAALATTPSNVSSTLLYEDNAGQWTCTASANFNCASASNPYSGTKDIEATTAVLNNNVTLVKPAAGTVDLSQFNTLTFYLRSKATWPTGNGTGSNGLRTLSVFWLNGSTQIGSQVVVRSGVFGFNSSITSGYQQINIPTSLFGTGSTACTTLKFNISGNGGTSSIGFYIDLVSLQAGFGSASLPATLMNFRGTWTSTTAYVPNDLIVSNGAGYVALLPSTNVAVPTTATWATLSPTTGGCNLYTLSNNGTNWTVAVNGGTAVVGAAISAATSQTITIVALGARQKVQGINLKTTTAWSGTGFTSFAMTTDDSVGGSTFYTSGTGGATSYDLFAAVSNTNFSDWVMFKSATFAGSNIQATITANQNLNTNTITGVLAMDICVVTLP